MNAAFRARHPRGISTLTADAIYGATGVPWAVGEKAPTTASKADFSASAVADPDFHSDHPGSVLEIGGPGHATGDHTMAAFWSLPDFGISEGVWATTLPLIILAGLTFLIIRKF